MKNQNKYEKYVGEMFWKRNYSINLYGLIVSYIFSFVAYTARIFLFPFADFRIGLLHHRSIGRLASHTEYYLRNKKYEGPIRKRKIDLLISGEPANQYLLDLFSRHARILKSNLLWKTLDFQRQKSVDSALWINLRYSGFDRRESWFEPGPQISLNSDDHARGVRLLEAIGIPDGSEYVCFHARDRLYKDSPDAQIDQESFWYKHDHRYCDERNFLKAADYLTRQGIYVIRVGFEVERPLDTQNPMIVDYPVSFRPNLTRIDREFIDVYISGTCKFFLGNTSGIYVLASIFGVPIAYTNMIPICDNGRTPEDIFIPRKYFDTKNECFLPYRSILDRGWDKDTLTQEQLENLAADGIQIVENTADEICDLAVEMNERIDNTWTEKADEEELMDSYREIFPAGHPMRSFPGRVGTKFMRTNHSLLGQ